LAVASQQPYLPSAGRHWPVLWLIDLDNTLYDASWKVMGEVNRRMTAYVAKRLHLSWEDASALRERYWRRYGATLLGLIRHHGVDAHDFLRATHPDHELPSLVTRIRGERQRIAALKGQRWLLTNAPRAYAQHVLRLIGLEKMFSRLISIEDMRLCGRLRPKPSHLLYRRLLHESRRAPHHVVLVDDHDGNLKAAHQLGMPTARILASKTLWRQARALGRPLAVRRPAYVRLQVNSLSTLVRSQQRLARRRG
jgi:putative hydrolase of the HAD superfamily